jgi:plastocyanin
MSEIVTTRDADDEATDTVDTDDETTDAAGDATDAAEPTTDVASGDDGDGGDQLELAAAPPPEEPVKDRLLIPALLPFLCMIAVALYTLNVSRVFLAGDSTSALVIAAGITISILVGGTIIAASPRLRTSSLVMVMGFVLVIVVSAGLLSLGPSLNTGESGGGGPLAQPTGAAGSTVSVQALASIKFNATEFTAKAGVVQIDYGGAAGHTLQFRTLDYKGFPLSSSGGASKGKVTLKPGKYAIYCTIDSHAAQGMEATITVTP